MNMFKEFEYVNAILGKVAIITVVFLGILIIMLFRVGYMLEKERNDKIDG